MNEVTETKGISTVAVAKENAAVTNLMNAATAAEEISAAVPAKYIRATAAVAGQAEPDQGALTG
jgi:hypothetical protein